MAPPAADHDLLLRYARDRDDSAFAALAHRYVPLVRSAAARRLGDRHLADDVTQAVFMILSRKAHSLSPDKPLSLWLLTTTRYACANALKLESRRRRHETAAAATPASPSAPGVCSPDPSEALLWQEVSSQLDDAVLKLPSLDRRVVLLRYFEDRPIREIAVELNTTEGAIKQRLSRAVDKLRARLDRTTGGVLAAISADRLAFLLSSRAVLPAPAGLVAAASSITSIASSSTLTPHIAKGAMKMMTWTKAKLAASIAVALALSGAGGLLTLNNALAQSDSPKPAATAQPDQPSPKKSDPAPDQPKPKKADNYLGIVTVADAPPVVIETSPKSGASDVDPATTELKVTFSKDMQDGSWSWAQISDASFPQITAKPHYEPDHRTCILPVKLEPNHTYILQLNYPPFTNFTDPTGRQAVRYLLVFQTRG